MSVHNGARFLGAAIASVLEQTLAEFELIVIDDGSTDGTGEILAAITDPRIRVIGQDHRGLAAALNRGIGVARAPLLARMDADDVSLPERLHKQLRFLRRHPDIAVLGTAVELISETGVDLGHWRPATEHETIRARMIRANQFAHPTVMFRKSAVLAVGGYREDMPFAQDYDLWLRMVPSYRTANLPEALLVRRIGRDQYGSARETRQQRWALRARLDALRRGDFPPRHAIGLLPPLVSALLPGPLRQAVRKILGRGSSGTAEG